MEDRRRRRLDLLCALVTCLLRRLDAPYANSQTCRSSRKQKYSTQQGARKELLGAG